jgi:hypothetical protein
VTKERRTIAKPGGILVKLLTVSVPAPEAPADSGDDKEDPGRGPEDKQFECEKVEIVSLPHFG